MTVKSNLCWEILYIYEYVYRYMKPIKESKCIKIKELSRKNDERKKNKWKKKQRTDCVGYESNANEKLRPWWKHRACNSLFKEHLGDN